MSGPDDPTPLDGVEFHERPTLPPPPEEPANDDANVEALAVIPSGFASFELARCTDAIDAALTQLSGAIWQLRAVADSFARQLDAEAIEAGAPSTVTP